LRKVLTLLGDFYHDHDKFLEVVKYALKDKEIELLDSSIDNFHEYLVKKPDLLILGRENKINPQEDNVLVWMSEDIEKDLVEYVKNGGKLIVWHSGLASYNVDGPYVSLIRGYFKHHPEPKLVTYYGNNIEFSFIDEHYFVHCDEKNTNVFLRSRSEYGDSIAGWTHNFGKGRVICLTPAHDIGLKDKKFRDYFKSLIENMI